MSEKLIKIDTSYKLIKADGIIVRPGGGSGETNLTYTASPTQGQVNSDTGTNAIIPATDGTNAGLFLPEEKTKLSGIESGAEVNVNADWNAVSGGSQILNKPTIPTVITDHTGLTSIGTNTHAQIDTHIGSSSNPHSVTKTQVGLSNVDNTSDLNKPISTATQTALNAKQDTLISGTNIKTINSTSLVGSGNIDIGGAVDSVNGQTGVVVVDADDIDDTSTTHKFTTSSDISKLAGIESGAEVNNISDTNATDLTDGGETTLHIHDSRYYTESEVDTFLSGKQNTITNSDSITEGTTNLFLTSSERTKLTNTSGTNTGDNATNTQYSGLASSKQDTLVSGTNIKTINSTTLLGSGDIAVEPTITAGTTAQYYRGDKTFQTLDKTAVGLGNVDNTSDSTKNSATATLTNKTISGTTNTISVIGTNFTIQDAVDNTRQARFNAGSISASATRTLSLPNVNSTIVARTSTDTLTNKRITKRTGTTTSSATPTINTNNVDFYSITALAVNITSFTTNLSGTPTDGQTLWIAITGTATRTIAWGASFEASTIALPVTTVGTARLDVGFVWNAVTSKWRIVATC
jgi:hypothetical protein